MKKTSLIFALMMLLALPVFGQAAEATVAASAEEIQTAQTEQTTTYGMQYGRRNRMPMNPAQTAPDTEENTMPAMPQGRQFMQGGPMGMNPARMMQQKRAQMMQNRAQMMQENHSQMMQQNRAQMMQEKRAQLMQQNRFVDENADGLCDVCGQEPGKNTTAPGYIDADGNGVCDHFGTDMQGQNQKQFNRSSQAGQNSQAPGFTDADSNGVCDYFGTDQQQGPGQNRMPHGRNRR